MAVRRLLALDRGAVATPLLLLPTRMIIRRSCGCETYDDAPERP